MKINIPIQQLPDRKIIPLREFNYSQDGLYFITINIKDMKCSFGNIVDKKMILNNIGKNANDFWLEIPYHFPNVILHEYIIMPNHTHGIIEIRRNATDDAVGTRHVVSLPETNGDSVRTSHVMSEKMIHNNRFNQFSKPIPGSISVIIQQYKSSVKRWCNRNDHSEFQWQSRFYEHVIRSELSYRQISDYISNNPDNWKNDKFYQE